jgi:hypothetical protein
LVAKLNRARLEGNRLNPSGFAFAADFMNVGDKQTKFQGFIPAIGFHDLKCKPAGLPPEWGVLPIYDVPVQLAAPDATVKEAFRF